MGRRGYPVEFRRNVLDLVEAGRPIAKVAKALGISAQSIYTWRRHDRIDNGLTQACTVDGLGSRSNPAAPRHFGFCYPIGRRARRAALDVAVGQAEAQYQRTARAMTSGGKQKPANSAPHEVGLGQASGSWCSPDGLVCRADP